VQGKKYKTHPLSSISRQELSGQLCGINKQTELITFKYKKMKTAIAALLLKNSDR
jgi:hypothetical protein